LPPSHCVWRRHELARSGPWTFRQGLSVLSAFLLVCAVLAAGHVLLVKQGFETYLGHDPCLPHMPIVRQTIRAAALAGIDC